MCPVHWTAFAIAAVPASLGALGFLGLRLKRAAKQRKTHEEKV
jgi:hypothetical protein